jgi:hypothetical protein
MVPPFLVSLFFFFFTPPPVRLAAELGESRRPATSPTTSPLRPPRWGRQRPFIAAGRLHRRAQACTGAPATTSRRASRRRPPGMRWRHGEARSTLPRAPGPPLSTSDAAVAALVLAADLVAAVHELEQGA